MLEHFVYTYIFIRFLKVAATAPRLTDDNFIYMSYDILWIYTNIIQNDECMFAMLACGK